MKPLAPSAPRAQKNAWEAKNTEVGNLMRSPDVQNVLLSPVVTFSQLRTAAQSELPGPSRKEWSLTWETVQTAGLL